MSDIIKIEGISLPKNDYQQPTEVRDWVVKEIVRVVVKAIQEDCKDWTLGIPTHGTMYLNQISPDFRSFCPDAPSKETEPYIKVRGVEMQKVWRVLQSAGYYVYEQKGTCYDTCHNEHLPVVHFHWDKHPYWRMRNADGHAEFNYFIDK